MTVGLLVDSRMITRNNPRRILVVGGTGLLGEPVARSLKQSGFTVKVLSRSVQKARDKFDDNYEIAYGDVGDFDSLKNALEDCQGVHINLKGGPKKRDFDRIEHRGTVAVVKAASELGVGRISYISGSSVAEDRCWFAPTRAKFLAEKAIADSGLDYAIFRATWFMESLPSFVRGDKATVMGNQPHKLHWVAAEDYARMVARAHLLEGKISKTFLVFGPQAFTMKEALEIFCQAINPGIRVTTVPLSVLSFIARVTFNRPLKEALPLMRYFEKTGELGDPAETDRILGRPQTTLKEWSIAYNRLLS